MPYEVVVGLEVHAELCTASKIFCGCQNAFGAAANTLCCPVCTGMPGALPVLNGQVVDYAIKMGYALGCRVSPVSRCARKHYFYPDLPKGYQISQQERPLCEDGLLTLPVAGGERKVGIERVHIEEDAGKLTHRRGATFADYNRCGVPLIEIVTRPDLRGAEEAKAFLQVVRDILLYLGISDARMQEGSMRADVNVSVRRRGARRHATRVEMKNVNSFGAVQRAIEFEAARQQRLLEEDGVVEQQTRHWDDAAGQSVLLREKEDSQDYRYLPDPDLLDFAVDPAHIAALKEEVPELPIPKARRFVRQYGLRERDAALLAAQRCRADFFEQAAGTGLCATGEIANWLLGDVARWLRKHNETLAGSALRPKALAELVAMVEQKAISGPAAKELLEVLLAHGGSPGALAEERELLQIVDEDSLGGIVRQVLRQNPTAVDDYRRGKRNALTFLVGRCMAASQKRGDPQVLRQLLLRELGGG